MGLCDQTNSAQHPLEKLRAATASVSAAQKIAQRDYEQAQAEADKWIRRYQLALKVGRDDLARQAQFQKERYQAIASRLKNLIDEQTPQVDTIKSSLKSWEKKVSESQKKENKILDIETNLEDILKTDDFILINLEDVNNELQPLKEVLLLPPKAQEQTKAKKDTKVLLTEAIHEIEETVTNAIANQEGIQKDFEKAQKEAKYWNEKAQTALRNNDNDLALQAVVNKKVQNKIMLILQTQLQYQEGTIDILVRNLIALESIVADEKL